MTPFVSDQLQSIKRYTENLEDMILTERKREVWRKGAEKVASAAPTTSAGFGTRTTVAGVSLNFNPTAYIVGQGTTSLDQTLYAPTVKASRDYTTLIMKTSTDISSPAANTPIIRGAYNPNGPISYPSLLQFQAPFINQFIYGMEISDNGDIIVVSTRTRANPAAYNFWILKRNPITPTIYTPQLIQGFDTSLIVHNFILSGDGRVIFLTQTTRENGVLLVASDDMTVWSVQSNKTHEVDLKNTAELQALSVTGDTLLIGAYGSISTSNNNDPPRFMIRVYRLRDGVYKNIGVEPSVLMQYQSGQSNMGLYANYDKPRSFQLSDDGNTLVVLFTSGTSILGAGIVPIFLKYDENTESFNLTKSDLQGLSSSRSKASSDLVRLSPDGRWLFEVERTTASGVALLNLYVWDTEKGTLANKLHIDRRVVTGQQVNTTWNVMLDVQMDPTSNTIMLFGISGTEATGGGAQRYYPLGNFVQLAYLLDGLI